MDPSKSSGVYTSINPGPKDPKARTSTFTKPSFTKLATGSSSSDVNYPDILPGGFQPGKKSMLF